MTKDKVIKNTSLVFTIICFFLICIFSLKAPSSVEPSINLNDKLMHCVAYFCFSACLTMYAQFLTEHKKTLLLVCIAISLFLGLSIELIQPHFNRTCDVIDFVADALGTMIGCVAALRFFPHVITTESEER